MRLADVVPETQTLNELIERVKRQDAAKKPAGSPPQHDPSPLYLQTCCLACWHQSDGFKMLLPMFLGSGGRFAQVLL